LSEWLSVGDVAAAVHVNPDYLSRTFKKATGENLNNRINAQKVERAKQYLCSSRLSVQEIAFKLGFSEYRYFCAVFKKVSGTTPLAYRRALLQGGPVEEP
jgi:two-component system response regulator YesN